MKFHWPQITYLIIYALTLVSIGILDHLLPRRRQLPLAFVYSTALVWLLWCGGFFG